MDGALMFWCFLIVFLFSMSLYVVIKQKMYKSFGVIAILLSVFSIIWVAIDCYKKYSSEACGWGQAFMPFYLGLAIFLFTPFFFLAYFFGKKLWLKFK